MRDERGSETDYARPPQMPSMEMRRKTKAKLTPSFASLKMPIADSTARVMRMKLWRIAGAESSLPGSGGRPRVMDERERKTVDW